MSTNLKNILGFYSIMSLLETFSKKIIVDVFRVLAIRIYMTELFIITKSEILTKVQQQDTSSYELYHPLKIMLCRNI